MMKLILFDIDGTLIHVHSQVTRGVIRDVVRRGLLCEDDLEGIELHGKTDRQIFRELCAAAGCSGEDAAARCTAMEELLLENWRKHLRRDTIDLLPGVQELLERLASHEGVRLGLLTGNLEQGARLKLAPHDLNRYFPYGSFGSDAIDRNQLPPIALERASAHEGRPFTFDRTLIIGDSHRDIECARVWGIAALAVATGSLSLDHLLDHAPDAACSTLLESDFIFEFIQHT